MNRDRHIQQARAAVDSAMGSNVIDALSYRPRERVFPPIDDPVADEPVAAVPDAGRVVLVRGTDLTPEPIRWLWGDWLALGKLHILAGAPGQGKTTIALAMAATVTIGGRWPDGGRSDKGNVLIWSGEDDPADTLLLLLC